MKLKERDYHEKNCFVACNSFLIEFQLGLDQALL